VRLAISPATQSDDYRATIVEPPGEVPGPTWSVT